MSTLLYGALTAKREAANKDKSSTVEPPATKPYVDALAGLVPAEVLILHGVVLGFSTTTKEDDKTTPAVEPTTTSVTDPQTLKWAFLVLAALSVAFYLSARYAAKDKDKVAPSRWILLGQCCIPPLSLACWTMLQKVSAFDGIWATLASGPRQTIGVLGAVTLSLAAGFLGYQLDSKPPKSKPT